MAEEEGALGRPDAAAAIAFAIAVVAGLRWGMAGLASSASRDSTAAGEGNGRLDGSGGRVAAGSPGV